MIKINFLDNLAEVTIKIPQTVIRNKMILDFNTPDFLQERDFIIGLYK